ncbi:MAG: glycoside hydrolase family 13 protein [Candidatus Zixiibacteriota bacterium]|nr:MAG: glycoside hydrolase family 13 protein [candidate division Zixibacteria bacterium]
MKHSHDPVPDWARHGIAYEVFVDSFAVGKVSIDGKRDLYRDPVYDQEPFTLRWHETSDDYRRGHGFYGGDLAGITYAVDHYLNDLRVKILYLTPIFKGASNHKYDTLDYYAIDPQFGTLEDFHALVEACNRQGMKLILDGSFNHTSSEHEWMQKAVAGDPRYLDYYRRDEHGLIEHWEAAEHIPVLNHENPEVRRYFYESDDSVLLYWLKQGAHGWRLDVAERLGETVLRNIRRQMKAHFPDALLAGEAVETYGADWLKDGLLDATMNYVFKGITTNFFIGTLTGGQYMEQLERIIREFPWEKLQACWNLVSSHDTNRMLYDVGGDEALFKMAVVFQFTFPGIPMIYYGDELGIEFGEKEISNRTAMDWESIEVHRKFNRGYRVAPMGWEKLDRYNSYHEFHRHMIRLRYHYQVLRDGLFLPVYADDTAIAYARVLEEKMALVIANRGEGRTLSLTLPQELLRPGATWKCEYGTDEPLKLDGPRLDFPAEAHNTYLFLTA